MNKYYNQDKTLFNQPQEYKDFLILPLKLRQSELYSKLISYFSLPKNHIPDKHIIKMTYFKYLLYVYESSINHSLKESNQPTVDVEGDLIELFSNILVAKEGEISKDKDGKIDIKILRLYKKNVTDRKIETYEDLNMKAKIEINIGITKDNKVKNIVLTESDFDNIREILLEQNGSSLDFVNQYDPELEEKLVIYRKKNESATLEEQIFSFCAVMKKLPEEIMELSFYQFNKIYKRLGILSDYKTYKGLESSGQIKFKRHTILHWSDHVKERNRYDEILITKEAFEQNEFHGALQKK